MGWSGAFMPTTLRKLGPAAIIDSSDFLLARAPRPLRKTSLRLATSWMSSNFEATQKGW